MDEYGLGPNGAMLYCMEYLEENFDWLEEKLSELEGGYFVFDVAGQVSSVSLRAFLDWRVEAEISGIGQRLKGWARLDSWGGRRNVESSRAHLRPLPSPLLSHLGRPLTPPSLFP